MASPFLRPAVATNRLFSGGSSRAIAMAPPRTVFDPLSPHKKHKPSPSPLAASDPLPTNNPTASPSLSTLLTGAPSLPGSVLSCGGSPCYAGDPTSSLNPSSRCFSVVGEIQEKGSDGTVGPSSGVASVSGSDEKVGGLASEEAPLQNPSCETVADVGDLASADSNVAVPSSMRVDHAGDPSFIEGSVRNRSADSFVDSGAEVSVRISDDQKKRIDINRSFARAKRNLRTCMERVSEARAEGLGSFKLEELLVEETWLEALPGEFQKPYMKNLCRFVECEVGGKVAIYPPPFLIFNALNSTSFDRVKVVIIGQDPYHGPGQAMGLSFSVPQGVKMPSSLLNIFKELQADDGCSIPSHGNLERWAIQGVLLLNAVLTVRQHLANSHAKRGWEVFTDAVIQTISQKKRSVVFLLWGNSAQEKSRLIDASKHHVLKAAHPSGLSAHRGFFGCRHFSRTNQILEAAGLLPINWQL